ncbi:response regulator [Alicyclobacillus tolerans]|uniref:AAA family ATPase n=1 Tax=Alicyclobacillus tolerans TaxID=90970 RepID=UPI001EFFFCCC|nr:response regulator [Alicyclobacillus tolerans]MCF8563835.1 response regulator [Alicyclobacillus tolerans]
MSSAIQVMVVDDSAETRQSLRMLLSFAEGIDVIAEAENGAEALHRLAVFSPDIVLMDLNMPVLDGIAATERICNQYPGIAVIALSVQNDVEYVRRCMRAGAKDYLLKPANMETLASTIEQVYREHCERSTRNAVAKLSEQLVDRPKTVALLSAKGGVGKTTIAVNTAVALAEQGKRVVLVDFDVQFGDTTLMLNLSPERTVLDLVRESTEIDPDVLDRYLSVHSSGISVLAAPQRPEEAEYLEAAHVRVILQSLQKKFDYVVVDTAPVANDVFFAILDTSDERFLVSTMNLAILKNNRMLMDLLIELNYDPAGVKHVLNRANAKNGLKVRDVERILKSDIYWELDNDYQWVESSINEGIPFVLKDKQHRLSKQLFAFTARLEEHTDRISRRNPLRKLISARARMVR